MHTLAALILGLACLVIAPFVVRFAYEIPKKGWIVLGGLIVAATGVGAASVFNFPQWVGLGLLGLSLLWLIRSVTSVRPNISLSTAMWMSGVVWLVSVATQDFTMLMYVLGVAGILNSLYAIVQAKKGWFNPDKAHKYAVGFVGNTNMLGNFLVGIVAVVCWLGIGESYWWLLGLLPIGWAIKLTHCKTAYIGLGTFGLVVVSGLVPWYVTGSLLIAGLLHLNTKKNWWQSPTWKERLNYWTVALEQFKRTPVFGVGLDCFKTEVPFLQRDINLATKGEFLKFENYECPYPQKAHSDIMQTLMDVGVVGLVSLYGLVGLIFWNFWPTNFGPDWIIAGGVCGLLVSGLGFHLLHIVPSNVVFWSLLLGLTIGAGSFSLSPVAVLVGLTIMTFVALDSTFKDLLVSYYEAKFVRLNGEFDPSRAFELQPSNSFLHTQLAFVASEQGRLGPLFYHTRAALEHYDGDQQIWHLYTNLAKACMLGGGLGLAKDCTIQALSFLPRFEEGRKLYNQIKDIEIKVSGVNLKGGTKRAA